MFKFLWRWLFSKGATPTLDSTPGLYSIDVEALAKELSIEKNAIEEGSKNQPHLESSALSGTESLVAQYVEKARHDYVHWATLRVTSLNQSINANNVNADVAYAMQLDSEFDSAANALISDQGSYLESLAESARTAQSSLAHFKQKHNLSRDAVVLEPSKRMLFITILFFLVLIEALANMALFAEGSDQGMVGGLAMAALCAFVNVITAYLLGKIPIRFVFHSNFFCKFLGIIAILFTLCWLVIVALSIGHFRDALQAFSNEDAPKMALQALQQAPFEFQNIYSWLLFAISIIFGVVAIWDGLKSSDLYPGYEHITIRTKKTEQEYDDELSDLRQELEELKEEYLTNLDAISSKVQASVKIIQTRIDDKKSTSILLENKLKDAEQALAALLHRYRTENKLARTDQAFPSYFNVLPELHPLTIPSFEIDNNAFYLSEQQTLVNEFLSALQKIRARIQSSHTQKFDSLQPIQNQF
jgi:hypothetical protein